MLYICHPPYEYLRKVDFVARFPLNRRFLRKNRPYQELFYVVTLTASSAQPKRRQKRENKQATALVSKTKTLNARPTFWQIYLPSLPAYWRGQTWSEWRYKRCFSLMVASSIPGSVAIVATSISSEITVTKTYLNCALHDLCIEHSYKVGKKKHLSCVH